MPKYLYTSDLRISELEERIRNVAIKLASDVPITDKSEANNSATLQFYFNLDKGTKTLDDAQTNPVEVIRNYILKFQFPNPRTAESLNDSIEERMFLAPYRMVISVLYAIINIEKTYSASISIDEILYFIFCDSNVFTNPEVEVIGIANAILNNRNNSIDLQHSIDNSIEWKQYERQSREMFTVLEKGCHCFSLRKSMLTMNIANISEEDEAFIDSILKNGTFWYPSDSNDLQLSQKEYISYMDTNPTPYNIIKFNKVENLDKKEVVAEQPLQQIHYGAPGTGKSHLLKQETQQWESQNRVVRTTFHPDSDYSTFVGAYKPTTDIVPKLNSEGNVLKKGGGTIPNNQHFELSEVVTEKIITYEFIPQAFLQAYVDAWKDTQTPEYLIIEEINRGNCAQIFGDLFQLLDRGDDGFSDYAIRADKDMQKFLASAFANVEFDEKFQKIKTGEELLLPSNLFLRATMNTSDQSLFPIDSAFKRRWDWKYMPIHNAQKNWYISLSNAQYDWWQFLSNINNQIGETTNSEDKKLGYFFCKAAPDGSISPNTFVSKVCFYIWNDVFKDYGFDASFFHLEDGTTITFDKFYSDDAQSVQEDVVEQFLKKLDLKPINETEAETTPTT